MSTSGGSAGSSRRESRGHIVRELSNFEHSDTMEQPTLRQYGRRRAHTRIVRELSHFERQASAPEQPTLRQYARQTSNTAVDISTTTGALGASQALVEIAAGGTGAAGASVLAAAAPVAAIGLIATGLLDEEPEPDSRIAFTSGTEKTTLQIIEERTGKVATISATGAATTGAVGYGAQFLGAVHIIPAAAAKGVATAAFAVSGPLSATALVLFVGATSISAYRTGFFETHWKHITDLRHDARQLAQYGYQHTIARRRWGQLSIHELRKKASFPENDQNVFAAYALNLSSFSERFKDNNSLLMVHMQRKLAAVGEERCTPDEARARFKKIIHDLEDGETVKFYFSQKRGPEGYAFSAGHATVQDYYNNSHPDEAPKNNTDRPFTPFPNHPTEATGYDEDNDPNDLDAYTLPQTVYAGGNLLWDDGAHIEFKKIDGKTQVSVAGNNGATSLLYGAIGFNSDRLSTEAMTDFLSLIPGLNLAAQAIPDDIIDGYEEQFKNDPSWQAMSEEDKQNHKNAEKARRLLARQLHALGISIFAFARLQLAIRVNGDLKARSSSSFDVDNLDAFLDSLEKGDADESLHHVSNGVHEKKGDLTVKIGATGGISARLYLNSDIEAFYNGPLLTDDERRHASAEEIKHDDQRREARLGRDGMTDLTSEFLTNQAEAFLDMDIVRFAANLGGTSYQGHGGEDITETDPSWEHGFFEATSTVNRVIGYQFATGAKQGEAAEDDAIQQPFDQWIPAGKNVFIDWADVIRDRIPALGKFFEKNTFIHDKVVQPIKNVVTNELLTEAEKAEKQKRADEAQRAKEEMKKYFDVYNDTDTHSMPLPYTLLYGMSQIGPVPLVPLSIIHSQRKAGSHLIVRKTHPNEEETATDDISTGRRTLAEALGLYSPIEKQEALFVKRASEKWNREGGRETFIEEHQEQLNAHGPVNKSVLEALIKNGDGAFLEFIANNSEDYFNASMETKHQTFHLVTLAAATQNGLLNELFLNAEQWFHCSSEERQTIIENGYFTHYAEETNTETASQHYQPKTEEMENNIISPAITALSKSENGEAFDLIGASDNEDYVSNHATDEVQAITETPPATMPAPPPPPLPMPKSTTTSSAALPPPPPPMPKSTVTTGAALPPPPPPMPKGTVTAGAASPPPPPPMPKGTVTAGAALPPPPPPMPKSTVTAGAALPPPPPPMQKAVETREIATSLSIALTTPRTASKQTDTVEPLPWPAPKAVTEQSFTPTIDNTKADKDMKRVHINDEVSTVIESINIIKHFIEKGDFSEDALDEIKHTASDKLQQCQNFLNNTDDTLSSVTVEKKYSAKDTTMMRKSLFSCNREYLRNCPPHAQKTLGRFISKFSALIHVMETSHSFKNDADEQAYYEKHHEHEMAS